LREGTKAVNATSDILLMYSFPWCSSISLPPILSANEILLI
jgi:hypothetical protein